MDSDRPVILISRLISSASYSTVAQPKLPDGHRVKKKAARVSGVPLHRRSYAGGSAMGRYDHIVDWFKKRHDTLIDNFEPLQAGSRRVMEFDGSEWRDITPKMIRETG